MGFARATHASYVVGLSQGFWKCRVGEQSSCTVRVLLVMLDTCKTEIPMISSMLFSFLALEGLQLYIFTVEDYMGFFSFLRRSEENKVAFGSAESIQEAGLLFWVSKEFNLLLLSGESVMSFLNRKSLLLCQHL